MQLLFLQLHFKWEINKKARTRKLIKIIFTLWFVFYNNILNIYLFLFVNKQRRRIINLFSYSVTQGQIIYLHCINAIVVSELGNMQSVSVYMQTVSKCVCVVFCFPCNGACRRAVREHLWPSSHSQRPNTTFILTNICKSRIIASDTKSVRVKAQSYSMIFQVQE